MNLIKKPDKQSVTVFLEERDLQTSPEDFKKSLLEIFQIAADQKVFLKFGEIKDIPIQHFSLLCSFIKSLKIKNISVFTESEKLLEAAFNELNITEYLSSVRG